MMCETMKFFRMPVFSRQLSSVRSLMCSSPSSARSTSSGDSESARRVRRLVRDSASFQEIRNEDPDGSQGWSRDIYSSSRSQANKAHEPPLGVDPSETAVFLFPGQATAFVGMTHGMLRYPRVSQMFNAARTILGYDLLDVCMQGPKEELQSTRISQPAIFVTSLGLVEQVKDDRPDLIESCISCAGYSLGEITALVFAGAISFEDGLQLVKVRAQAMQLVSEMHPSGMMTVKFSPAAKIGYAARVAMEYCRKELSMSAVDCRVSAYLYPGCKVISGHLAALEFLEKNMNDFGIYECKRLPVSGAFHSEYMKPAVQPFVEALRMIDVKEPLISVHSCVDGTRYTNSLKIRKLLPKQLYSAVRWEQIMHILYEREDTKSMPKTVVFGPGSDLMSILYRVNRRAFQNAHFIKAGSVES